MKSCTPTTAIAQAESGFKIKTKRGTTFVIPLISKQCCDTDYQCTCALENSELVRIIAQGHKVLDARYIDDSARPVLLVEVD